MDRSEQTNAKRDECLAQAGDRAAFGRVMDAHLPMAYRLSIRWLGSSDEAKDVCQEAFVRVWEHFASYEPDRPFAAWLTTIVTRLCLDRLRYRQRWTSRWFRFDGPEDPEPVGPEPDPQRSAAWNDLAAIVAGLMKRLPPTQRIVFALRDLEHLEVAEVAEVSGLSTSSVKANLSYARRTLRTILAQEFDVKEANV